MRRYETEFADTAKELFSEQGATIVKVFDALSASGITDDAAQKAIAAIVDDVREGGWRDDWYKGFYDLIRDVVKLGGDELAGQIGFDWKVQSPYVSDAIANRASSLADLIGKTTADQILGAVEQARESSATARELSDVLRNTVFNTDETDTRSNAVARTEIGGAYNEGEYLSATNSGLDMEKTWFHSGNPNGRPEHMDMDGETVPIDEPFSNGLDYACDSENGDAEDIINCGCATGYSVIVDEGSDSND